MKTKILYDKLAEALDRTDIKRCFEVVGGDDDKDTEMFVFGMQWTHPDNNMSYFITTDELQKNWTIVETKHTGKQIAGNLFTVYEYLKERIEENDQWLKSNEDCPTISDIIESEKDTLSKNSETLLDEAI